MVGALTLSRVAQLSTHDSSISISPGFKTYSTPLIVHADLHSAFILNVTSCQSQLTSYTGSYIHKHIKWLGGCKYYRLLVHIDPFLCTIYSYIVLLINCTDCIKCTWVSLEIGKLIHIVPLVTCFSMHCL